MKYVLALHFSSSRVEFVFYKKDLSCIRAFYDDDNDDDDDDDDEMWVHAPPQGSSADWT